MRKKLLLTISLLCSAFYFTNAQNWQWGIRGGSSDIGGGGGSGPDETVVDMATDPNGNIYVLSKVLQTGLNVDGNVITNYGGFDMVVSSFKCDGTYRWSKDMGSNQDEVPIALKTDSLGGVYVAGQLGSFDVTNHVDADTSWFNATFQFFCITKFDTSGAYKWIRFPQSDTAGFYSASNTSIFDFDVDGAGNIYSLWELAPGAYVGGSYVVTGGVGVYMLAYDRNGNFINGNQMQITISGIAPAALKMKRDLQLGRYYVTGILQYATSGTLSFDGIPVAHMGFIGCFNTTGALLWQRQDTDPIPYYSSFGRAAVDVQHNIYLAGRESEADTFNTYAVVNGGSTALPVIYKLDTNGNNIWAKNATVNGATFCSVTTVNGSEVDIAGQYPGELKWPGYPDSLNLPGGALYHIFITRFNAATGAVLGIDSLASTIGANNNATAITSDKIGNFYIGGDFASQITVAGTTFTSEGGGSDFFVAKYGSANCSCTVLPTASFSSTTGSPHVTFTYTGTTGEDSVRWTFGDGSTSTAINPAHTYTASGTYTACVTVYTSCGSDSSCQSVHVILSGVPAIPAFRGISIYPNPATDQLLIENAVAGTIVSLFNIMGRPVYNGVIAYNSQVIDVHNLPAGNYIIRLTDVNGNRMNRTIIKE